MWTIICRREASVYASARVIAKAHSGVCLYRIHRPGRLAVEINLYLYSRYNVHIIITILIRLHYKDNSELRPAPI